MVDSASGAALGGATVTSAGRSTRSAADGSYTLTDVPAADAKVVRFDLAGHATGVLAVSVPAGGAARANARLTRVGASLTFDAAAGATIGVAGGTAQVALPAAGLVTAAGTP
ncbi:MAG: carboxypeptidase regulatory-like domain-containing protein, partial [Burkholderiaceae bacterium]